MSLFFTAYDPWTEIGPNRITDGQFETPACTKEWTGWDNALARVEPTGGFKRSGGVLLNGALKRTGILKMTVAKMKAVPAFRVSIRAAARGIPKSRHNWKIPSAVFVFQDQDGNHLSNLSHWVFDITKDSDWRQYATVFSVPENAVDARLQIRNLGAGGILAIDDVSVVPVTQRPSSPFFNLFFTLLWVAALVACLIVLEPWKTLPGTAALFCALTIIIGVLLPEKVLDDVIYATAETAQDVKQRIERPASRAPTNPATIQSSTNEPARPPASPAKKRPAPPVSPIKKLIERAHLTGHFTLFMILAFCSMLRWTPAGKPFAHILPITAGLILFAASTETLQFITLDRTPGLSDLAVDVAGILFAVIITATLTQTLRLFCKIIKRTE